MHLNKLQPSSLNWTWLQFLFYPTNKKTSNLIKFIELNKKNIHCWFF